MTVFFRNKLPVVGWRFHTFGKSLVSENRSQDSDPFPSDRSDQVVSLDQVGL